MINQVSRCRFICTAVMVGALSLLAILAGCTTIPAGKQAVNPATFKTYRIWGKDYHPLKSAAGYRKTGKASWYGRPFHGRKTANREIYNMYSMTAAHRTLPMNTLLLVRNLDNGRETMVRINDRGPFVKGRIIDLSYAAARKLGMIRHGVASIELIVMNEAAGAIFSGSAAAKHMEQGTNPGSNNIGRTKVSGLNGGHWGYQYFKHTDADDTRGKYRSQASYVAAANSSSEAADAAFAAGLQAEVMDAVAAVDFGTKKMPLFAVADVRSRHDRTVGMPQKEKTPALEISAAAADPSAGRASYTGEFLFDALGAYYLAMGKNDPLPIRSAVIIATAICTVARCRFRRKHKLSGKLHTDILEKKRTESLYRSAGVGGIPGLTRRSPFTGG